LVFRFWLLVLATSNDQRQDVLRKVAHKTFYFKTKNPINQGRGKNLGLTSLSFGRMLLLRLSYLFFGVS